MAGTCTRIDPINDKSSVMGLSRFNRWMFRVFSPNWGDSMNFAKSKMTGRAGLLIALFALMEACGPSATASKTSMADVVAQLTRQSDDWDKAIIRKDRAAIAANMTDDFRQIGSNGDVANKETFIQDLTADDFSIDPYTVEDFDVRVYGDVALLSGTTHMTGHQEGKPFKTQYRYIDVYRRIDGVWKVCSVQTSRLPA
jgi:ketosteroid isomerase-like protein